MKRKMKRTLAIVVLMWMVLPQGAVSQRKTGGDILALASRNYEGIKDYTVDLEAELNMERVRMPKMKATMHFKSPDKIHFESPNFALLPREGFGVPVTTLIQRYDAAFKGEETIEGVPAYKLQLVAKDPASRLQQLFVWINRANATMIRMTTVPYQGRSVRIDFSYMMEANRYWLPDTMHVELADARPDTLADAADVPVPGGAQIQAARRPPRHGTMTVVYSNYRINTGLSDDLFKREEREDR